MLDYQIADGAVYSDGKPVTCDDMVLTWAAQSGRFPGFDAASQALMTTGGTEAIMLGGTDLALVYDEASRLPNIDPVGVAVHIGSQ